MKSVSQQSLIVSYHFKAAKNKEPFFNSANFLKKLEICEPPASGLDVSCLMIETKSKECPDTVFLNLKIIPYKERQWWPIKI
jgi:hypothetical protein